MRVVDPSFAAPPSRVRPAPRPASLEGGVLGLLSNGKPNAAALLDAVAAGLRAGGRTVRYDKTEHGSGPSTPTPPWIVERLAAESMAVVLASGD
jgi:hypothetical protein